MHGILNKCRIDFMLVYLNNLLWNQDIRDGLRKIETVCTYSVSGVIDQAPVNQDIGGMGRTTGMKCKKEKLNITLKGCR